jgi:hypothetical protein
MSLVKDAARSALCSEHIGSHAEKVTRGVGGETSKGHVLQTQQGQKLKLEKDIWFGLTKGLQYERASDVVLRIECVRCIISRKVLLMENFSMRAQLT